MKKYKLIKKYPNCHIEIGELAWTEDCNTHFSNETYIPNEVIVYENYPEFWQLVVGKEYEILSWVNSNNNYSYSLRQVNSDWNIHSVKRLSS